MATCLVITPAFAETEQEIFERVFGKPADVRADHITVPLILNKTRRDPVNIIIGVEPQATRINSADLLERIHDRAITTLQQNIEKSTDSQGYISARELVSLGLEVLLDQQTVELYIDIPPELQQPSSTNLITRQPPFPLLQATSISPVSSYLNLRVAMDYLHDDQNPAISGRRPARLALEHAVRIHDWVMELNGTYTEAAVYPWQRGDARLVYDDTNRMQRYSFGDLSYPVSGFQNFQPMAGITMARNFSLQPYRITQPVSEADIFLKSPSKVEVLVNDRVVRTLRLDAGEHNIRDFPFTSGLNDVQLKITDDLGRTEIVEQPYFFDSNLLMPGLSEYSLSLGVPSSIQNGHYNYDTDLPGVSMFYRHGVRPELTLGGNLQVNRYQYMLGTEALWATYMGTLHADLAVSGIDSIGSGHRARLQYSYYDAGSALVADQHWTAYVDYTAPAFAALGNLAPLNMVSYETGASYSQRLGLRTSGGLALGYQAGRYSFDDARLVDVFLTRSLGPFVTTRLNVEYRHTGSHNEKQAFLSLLWSPRDGRSQFTTTFDTNNQSSSVLWQRNPEYSVDDTELSLGTEHSDNNSRIFGHVRYVGYRAETSFSSDIIQPTDGQLASQQLTSVQFATAAVYAQGHFAISRPVTDSFAIIVPNRNLERMIVGVDPVEEHFAARTDRFGDGVLPNLPSYFPRKVNIHVPDLPMGQDLGQDSFVLLPRYKSGTVIEVDTNGTVLLGGILHNSKGEVLALQAGEITAPGKPDWQARTLFTNRKGIFRVDGLEPGSYELRMFSEPDRAIRFDIPADAFGFYDIGTLTLAEPKSVSQR